MRYQLKTPYNNGTTHEEFESYLKCGQLEHGFLRVPCDTCHRRAAR